MELDLHGGCSAKRREVDAFKIDGQLLLLCGTEAGREIRRSRHIVGAGIIF
jgi:hypothetical protein